MKNSFFEKYYKEKEIKLKKSNLKSLKLFSKEFISLYNNYLNNIQKSKKKNKNVLNSIDTYATRIRNSQTEKMFLESEFKTDTKNYYQMNDLFKRIEFNKINGIQNKKNIKKQFIKRENEKLNKFELLKLLGTSNKNNDLPFVNTKFVFHKEKRNNKLLNNNTKYNLTIDYKSFLGKTLTANSRSFSNKKITLYCQNIAKDAEIIFNKTKLRFCPNSKSYTTLNLL